LTSVAIRSRQFTCTSDNVNTNLSITINGRRILAVVIVTRSGDTRIDFRIAITVSGQATTGRSATATIRKASGKSYDMLDGSVRVGLINGTDFNLDYTDGGDRFALWPESK